MTRRVLVLCSLFVLGFATFLLVQSLGAVTQGDINSTSQPLPVTIDVTPPSSPAADTDGITASIPVTAPTAGDTSGDPVQEPMGAATDAVRDDVLSRINRERTERGLDGLAVDETLARAAQEWSETMPSAGYVHSSQDRLLGILTEARTGAISEIIHAPEPQCPMRATSCTELFAQPTSGVLHVDWLHSGAHRSAMLGERWERIGVGVHCTSDGRMYAVVLFGSAPGVYVDSTTDVPYDEPRVATNDGVTCDGRTREHNAAWNHSPIS